MEYRHALVLGATGATGKELINLLLNDSNFDKVTIFVRRQVELKHKKLNVHLIDFTNLNKYKALIKGDLLFSALGTTKKDAGSKEQQYLVDYTYQYEFAKMATENGVSHYSLVSSLGADENSILFYPKIKGKLEESVKFLDFKTIHIFQPPSLIRQAELIRAGEKLFVKLFKFFNSIGMLKALKPMPVYVLASKMISESFKTKKAKITIYKPEDIFKI